MVGTKCVAEPGEIFAGKASSDYEYGILGIVITSIIHAGILLIGYLGNYIAFWRRQDLVFNNLPMYPKLDYGRFGVL